MTATGCVLQLILAPTHQHIVRTCRNDRTGRTEHRAAASAASGIAGASDVRAGLVLTAALTVLTPFSARQD